MSETRTSREQPQMSEARIMTEQPLTVTKAVQEENENNQYSSNRDMNDNYAPPPPPPPNNINTAHRGWFQVNMNPIGDSK